MNIGDMAPALVVLAAGTGSRYGGLKQMDAIGDGGEALLDYSVYDALEAGFGRVIFIIRHAIEADFKSIVLSRMERRVPFTLVYQENDSLLPPELAVRARTAGRVKPWGTAHALLCAAEAIDQPFCVINADDFYSREAFVVMARFLAESGREDGAFVPYKLAKTLSPLGTVTRGVCAVTGGRLGTIEELTAIQRQADGRIINTFEDGSTRVLDDDTPVSMNFWGFPPRILPYVREYVASFLAEHGGEVKSECYLPMAAGKFIADGVLTVHALASDADWFGVTYKEDRELVAAKIRALIQAGVYPARLWG
ncbi:MAG: NTP transferase domain-containing protein [Spirochaetaceae bacterium]|jgi:hypothetical protein|nr:NTP transferase domain-containing protein [Spirochaetaceae bacterium]